MKILMFGWEFPPFSYGGLGTACKGIVEGLTQHNVHLTLVLPKALSAQSQKLTIAQVDDLLKGEDLSKEDLIKIHNIDSALSPYLNTETYLEYLEKTLKRSPGQKHQKTSAQTPYGKNLFEEIQNYASKAYTVGKNTPHDIIHSHDWLTTPAGAMAKKASGKPLVAHVHATEFDRTGDNPNQLIYDVEREGMEAADHIIAVSNFTKQKIVEHYGISPDKISVVHNAVNKEKSYVKLNPHIAKDDHVVLFLGRMTLQKGPEYFLQMAKRVLEKEPHTKFVMAGDGDMTHRMIELSAKLGIAKNVLFSGYLSGPEIDRAYAHADLYVMPSVSEPFGITPLEAIRNSTPVLISKQSGISEVIVNALRVDFWDIEEMANKTLAVIRYKRLKDQLISESQQELKRMSWQQQAANIRDVYHSLLLTPNA